MSTFNDRRVHPSTLVYSASLLIFLAFLGASVLPLNAQILLPGASPVAIQDNEGALTVEGAASVDEGENAIATLQLSPAPTGNVTVAISSADGGALGVTDSLTFGSGDAAAKNITLTGISDTDGTNESVVVTMRATSTEDTQYTDVTQTVTVTVVDDDSTGDSGGDSNTDAGTNAITLTGADTRVAEGGTGTAQVALASEPSADVVLDVVSSDATKLSLDVTSLTFQTTNWNTPQIVSYTVENDETVTDAAEYTVTVSVASASAATYAGTTAQTVTVSAVEDDVASLVVSESVTITEGETGEIMAMLNYTPSADVTVSVASSDIAKATVSPETLTFTSENATTGQTVTVSALTDEDFASEEITINFSTGSMEEVVAVRIMDADMPGLVVKPSATELAENGGVVTTTVSLEVDPGAIVGIVPSADASQVTFSPSEMSFDSGNFNTPQTLTITGVDNDSIEDLTATITLTAGTENSTNIYSGVSTTFDLALLDDDLSAATTAANPVTGTSNTIAVTGTECLVVSGYSIQAESALGAQDAGYDYPVGIHEYSLTCDDNGDATTATIYLDQIYDTGTLVARKYNTTTQVYSDVTGASFGTATVDGNTVTTLSVSLVDGGLNDEDGAVNGVIVDPIGAAQVVTTTDTGTDDDADDTDTTTDATTGTTATGNGTTNTGTATAAGTTSDLVRSGGYSAPTQTGLYLGMIMSGAVLLYGATKKTLGRLLNK